MKTLDAKYFWKGNNKDGYSIMIDKPDHNEHFVDLSFCNDKEVQQIVDSLNKSDSMIAAFETITQATESMKEDLVIKDLRRICQPFIQK